MKLFEQKGSKLFVQDALLAHFLSTKSDKRFYWGHKFCKTNLNKKQEN